MASSGRELSPPSATQGERLPKHGVADLASSVRFQCSVPSLGSGSKDD